MTPTIAPLRNVSALMGVVDQVHNRDFRLPGMAAFYGPSGWGKSSAIVVVANEFQAHCVQVMESSTPTFLLETIMDELGLPKMRGVPYMVKAIGRHLMKSDRPLIIDDAQYLLQKRMIGVVRDIYESSQAPIILVGEEKLPDDLRRWENVYNRLLVKEPAMPSSMEDARMLADVYCPNIAIGADLLGKLLEDTSGNTRNISNNLVRIKEIMRRSGKSEATLETWGDRAFETGDLKVRPKGQTGNADVVTLRKKAAGK